MPDSASSLYMDDKKQQPSTPNEGLAIEKTKTTESEVPVSNPNWDNDPEEVPEDDTRDDKDDE